MLGMRAVTALVLAAATLLAGCVAVSGGEVTPAAGVDNLLGESGTAGVFHGPDGELLDASQVADLPVARGAQFFLGYDATEPTVGATSDGSVFMTAFASGGATGRSTPTIVRTQDKGQTFEVVGPTLPTGDGVPPMTNDPFVHVDTATDRVYMLDLIGTVCSVLQWSDDLGETWTSNPAACGTPFVNDHQSITTAKPTTLPTTLYENVLYYCVNRVADSACATSLDGGLTFGPLKTVFTGASVQDQDFCGGLHAHVASGPDGTVYLPRGYCGEASVAITRDDGLTWTNHVIDTEHPVEGHEVSLAVDDENNVYATWNSKGFIYYSYSTDGGETWAPAKNATAPGVTATMFNTVAAAGPGKIAIAYVGSTIEGGYEGKDTGYGGLTGDILGEPEPKEWDNATWNGYIGIITAANTEEPVMQTTTANDPEDPLARGLCGRTRCNGMNDFIDIEVDFEGRPWAAFVDVCTQECVTDPTVKHDESAGFLGTILEGPSLLAGIETLSPITPPPASDVADAAE